MYLFYRILYTSISSYFELLEIFMIGYGSTVALVTPMTSKGHLDWSALSRLIEFHIESGTQNLVIAGTTGESSTLSQSEHIEVIKRACEQANGRIPIIAGTGSNSTAQTIELSRAVSDLPIEGFLVVVPYYNKPTQAGLMAHFSSIADAVSKPVILYNVPGRTAVDMHNDTIVMLSNHPNIVAVKEASGDLSRLASLKTMVSDGFLLLSGDDETACDFMLQGGHGCISVTANVVPKEMRLLCNYAIGREHSEAKGLDQKLQPLHQSLFLESNPIPVKYALKAMGLIDNGIRLPLTWLTKSNQNPIDQYLDKLKYIQ
jgi:4-hydroxy-tetrahydrodipicolinate synthase